MTQHLGNNCDHLDVIMIACFMDMVNNKICWIEDLAIFTVLDMPLFITWLALYNTISRMFDKL